MHSFISRQYGDCEDHSILLGSLLLGFHLNAYVCIGTTEEGVHVWVTTLIAKPNKASKVVFWESLTG